MGSRCPPSYAPTRRQVNEINFAKFIQRRRDWKRGQASREFRGIKNPVELLPAILAIPYLRGCMSINGFATAEGTVRYRERMAERAVGGHFRESNGLWLSSVGIGTYLGEADAETDERYTAAVKRAAELGCNVIDTAINYRLQRSERAIAKALQELIEGGKAQRDELVICTKAGFLSFDGAPPPNPMTYFQEEYLLKGVMQPEDVAGGMHCMAPGFLEDQLERSLVNLALDTIDVFHLHNPETQLQFIERKQFLARMRAAFETLEKAVAAGKIRCYGTATWDGYRKPQAAPDHLSLEDLVKLAMEVGGQDHHFKAVQLPLNLAMPEALQQPLQHAGSEAMPFLEAAAHFGMTVFTSASIFQGRIAAGMPDGLRENLGADLQNDAQRGIQFVRSAPGVTTALVGMSSVEHVEENLQLASVPPLNKVQFDKLFEQAG